MSAYSCRQAATLTKLDELLAEIDNALGNAYDNARDNALAYDIAYDDLLGSAHVFRNTCILDFAPVLERAHVLERTLDRDSGLDSDIDRVVNGVLSLVLAPDFPRSRGFQELAALAERARAQMAELRARASDESGRSEQPRCQADMAASKAADQVVAWAIRVLPADGRGRYAEEFRSELWGLAAAGNGRISQLRYAVLQLVCILSLRRELKASRATRQAAS